jgi:16S rRNA U516 pseudouridylate synthase RsuA-like enzyme
MVEAVGHRVKSLHRSTYAGLRLGKLKAGEWRELTHAEIDDLRRLTG